jgi:hypothetical protein
MARHETGRIVGNRNLGMTLYASSVECLKNLLLTMTPDGYMQLRGAIEAQPVSQFVDADDMARLMTSALTSGGRSATADLFIAGERE